MKLLVLLLSLLCAFVNADNVIPVDQNKVIVDKVANVTMRITYDYNLLMSNYTNQQDAIDKLHITLAEFFFLDEKRFKITNIRQGSVIIDFLLLPRLTNLDMNAEDALIQFNNGYYITHAPDELLWLTQSTISYNLLNGYMCSQGDSAPTDYVCVYNYQYTEVPIEDADLSRQYQIIAMVLSLILGGGFIVSILAAIRWCVNKTRNTVVKRQTVQMAVREIKADYV